MEPSKASIHFPNGFDFFDLGKVKTSSKVSPISESPFIVMFRATDRALGGIALGLCSVVFDQMPEDQSMGVEIANILASKFATMLSESTQNIVEISAPELLQSTEPRHRRLITTLRSAVKNQQNARSYEYTQGSKKLTLKMIYLPSLQGFA